MFNRDEVRERLVNFIQSEGVTQKYIADQTKISQSDLSKFKNKKLELYIIDLETLDEFLKSKGY